MTGRASGGFPSTGPATSPSSTSGDWIFLGRRDSQIKSRGYRIELGDIEAALNLHPAVVECAVVAIPDEVVTNRIKAFVVARRRLDGEELSRFCRSQSRYMTPEVYEFRDELPRSSTGKIDRRALSTPSRPPQRLTDPRRPQQRDRGDRVDRERIKG